MIMAALMGCHPSLQSRFSRRAIQSFQMRLATLRSRPELLHYFQSPSGNSLKQLSCCLIEATLDNDMGLQPD